MKVAVVGYGAEGQASLRYFAARGDEVTVCDQNKDIVVPESIPTHVGKSYLEGLDKFDLIIRTAGMHPKLILEASPKVQDKITTQVNEFLANCPSKNIIGITGTKGKGTTSTLIARMLSAAGKTVHLGGNIGTPVFDLINNIQKDDWVILELSSFQLIDVKHSPHIAVCLMVVPEHLNWHEDFEEYIAAKQQLFINQGKKDIAIYYAENEDSLSIADATEGELIPYMKSPGAVVKNGAIRIAGKEIIKTKDIKLLGEHNQQNACAAVTTVWQVVHDAKAMQSVLSSFTGLEHRLEFVRELEEIKYYDDSFGTTPETAIVAIQAFKDPKVVVLGGSDKGAAYEVLAETVKKEKVRHAILIGDTAPKIKAALKAVGFNEVSDGGKTMEEILTAARKYAKPGDVILLSTGCASFGLFTDYKDRGNQFKRVVSGLPVRAEAE